MTHEEQMIFPLKYSQVEQGFGHISQVFEVELPY
jgi:hypothetical protein